MAEVTLRIDGMHCGSCIRRVTQAIGSAGPVGTVEVKEVRLGAARYETTVDGAAIDPVLAALAKAGFRAQVDA